MYILTIRKISEKQDIKISTEVFTTRGSAGGDFFAAIYRYAKEKGISFSFNEADKKRIEKCGVFEHEDFGVYISEPDTDFQLIEEMDDSEIVQYLEENCRDWDVYLSKFGIQELAKNIEGNGYYLLRYKNLLEEMKAKEIAENFGK